MKLEDEVWITDGRWISRSFTPGQPMIAHLVSDAHRTVEDNLAIANLLAAAPQLLKACRQSIAAYDEIVTSNLPALVKASFAARFRSVENVRAAIAAAERLT